MELWQNRLKKPQGPSLLLVLLDLAFITLAIFLLSNNYVFLPGVKGASLPSLSNAEIVRANKLVITLTSDGHYIFNGISKENWKALEEALLREMKQNHQAVINRGGDGEVPVIVVRADRSVSYEKLVDFFSFARSVHAQVFLATEPEKTREPFLDNRTPDAGQKSL